MQLHFYVHDEYIDHINVFHRMGRNLLLFGFQQLYDTAYMTDFSALTCQQFSINTSVEEVETNMFCLKYSNIFLVNFTPRININEFSIFPTARRVVRPY